LLVLRGTFALIEFHGGGRITGVERFGKNSSVAVVEVPPMRWHTVLALTEGAILFEAKSGPYRPEAAKTPAAWAPAEGDPWQMEYLSGLQRAV